MSILFYIIYTNSL